MKNVFTVISIELLKLRKSMIFKITIGLSLFISFMMTMMMFLTMNPDILPPGILKTKITIAAFSADWPSYFTLLKQVSGALGMILFGFITSWIFGREYSDRTVKDLLSLPISRTIIFSSKFFAAFFWSLLLIIIIFVFSIAGGFAIGLPSWNMENFSEFTFVFYVSALFSFLLSPAAAFVASAGRGYFSGIAFILITMGLANFFGTIGVGHLFPWTIPMLFTEAIGTAGIHLMAVSYVVLFLTFVVGISATLIFWNYADQSR